MLLASAGVTCFCCILTKPITMFSQATNISIFSGAVKSVASGSTGKFASISWSTGEFASMFCTPGEFESSCLSPASCGCVTEISKLQSLISLFFPSKEQQTATRSSLFFSLMTVPTVPLSFFAFRPLIATLTPIAKHDASSWCIFFILLL